MVVVVVAVVVVVVVPTGLIYGGHVCCALALSRPAVYRQLTPVHLTCRAVQEQMEVTN